VSLILPLSASLTLLLAIGLSLTGLLAFFSRRLTRAAVLFSFLLSIGIFTVLLLVGRLSPFSGLIGLLVLLPDSPALSLTLLPAEHRHLRRRAGLFVDFVDKLCECVFPLRARDEECQQKQDQRHSGSHSEPGAGHCSGHLQLALSQIAAEAEEACRQEQAEG